jgi:ribosomal protein L40E
MGGPTSGERRAAKDSEPMKKTCPRCHRRVGVNARRCRRCGYAFPEGGGPRPAGLALGAGFPLFIMGTLTLFAGHLSVAIAVIASAMFVVGVGLFFDPR